MAGTEFRVCSTAPLAINTGEEFALAIAANATVGFLAYSISVAFQDLGSETGKAKINIYTAAGSAGGSSAIKQVTNGDTDDPTMTCTHNPSSLTTRLLYQSYYWPITTTTPATINLTGRHGPFKVSAGRTLGVSITGPAGSSTTKYFVTVDGEE